ncbi:hypothetical protein SCLCIDRAFT_23054 [Scleroderma citrinum Foug A]|uniref:Uncharacterized protein n=1 Tax=Scleroderma citrinum Foug A TaxID=1036808 RepID=A0A0C3E9B3_9AGAM|nr:hypothetical protein SCLCIDRAFT_23054 [Scleroderma citrinum Foug A]
MTSSTWMPTVPPSAPPSPVANPFLTPRLLPHVLSITPRRAVTPAVISPPIVSAASTVATISSLPVTTPAKPDKGKGHQRAAAATPPTSPVDPPPSVSTASAKLTPEQHVCFVRMLKRLDEWLAQGWQPGVDKSRLRTLAEIFNAAESVAEGSLCNIRCADLVWRLADSEGWEKSAGSSIMGAIDIQVTVTKILYKDYGESLIASFRSFLGQKEAELGDSGRPSGVSGLSLQKAAGRGDSKPNLSKRVRFSGLDGASGGAPDVRAERNASRRLLADEEVARVPTYDEACRSLAQHLTFIGGTTYTEWINFLFTLRRSPRSPPTTNFGTFSWAVDTSPTLTPLEDFDAFGATPLGIGPQTMTEIVDQFMEDLLTQEFSPVVLAEDS